MLLPYPNSLGRNKFLPQSLLTEVTSDSSTPIGMGVDYVVVVKNPRWYSFVQEIA